MDMETQIREALARGYCSPGNEHKTLDPALIEAMTQELIESFTPTRTEKKCLHTVPKGPANYCSDCHEYVPV